MRVGLAVQAEHLDQIKATQAVQGEQLVVQGEQLDRIEAALAAYVAQ